ncbi:MAG: hypothetical protein ACXAC5_01980 [Promethearchaeota archaeon]
MTDANVVKENSKSPQSIRLQRRRMVRYGAAAEAIGATFGNGSTDRLRYYIASRDDSFGSFRTRMEESRNTKRTSEFETSGNLEKFRTLLALCARGFSSGLTRHCL